MPYFSIETFDPNQASRIDFDEVQYGLGLIMEEIFLELSMIKVLLEK